MQLLSAFPTLTSSLLLLEQRCGVLGFDILENNTSPIHLCYCWATCDFSAYLKMRLKHCWLQRVHNACNLCPVFEADVTFEDNQGYTSRIRRVENNVSDLAMIAHNFFMKMTCILLTLSKPSLCVGLFEPNWDSILLLSRNFTKQFTDKIRQLSFPRSVK